MASFHHDAIYLSAAGDKAKKPCQPDLIQAILHRCGSLFWLTICSKPTELAKSVTNMCDFLELVAAFAKHILAEGFDQERVYDKQADKPCEA